MARQARTEYAGALYHVISRGNRRENIVHDDLDRNVWRMYLGEIVEKFGWEMYSYALLDNHYHLYFQIRDKTLSAGMRDFNTRYAIYYNSRYGKTGHLFQGRFKAVLIKSERHYAVISRYIHLNPVNAGLVEKPQDWNWSSYKGYLFSQKRMKWINYEKVLNEYGGDNKKGIDAYRRFVEVNVAELPTFKELLQTLGLESKVTNGDDNENEEKHTCHMQPHIDDDSKLNVVIDQVVSRFNCDRNKWRYGKRCDDVGRAIVVYFARRFTKMNAKEMSKRLGFGSDASISAACKRVKGLIRNDVRLAKEIFKLDRSLQSLFGVRPQIVGG